MLSLVVIALYVSMWLAGETPRSIRERIAARWALEAAVYGDPDGGWGGAG